MQEVEWNLRASSGLSAVHGRNSRGDLGFLWGRFACRVVVETDLLGQSMTDAYLIIGGVLIGGAALYAIPSVERRIREWRAKRRLR